MSIYIIGGRWGGAGGSLAPHFFADQKSQADADMQPI